MPATVTDRLNGLTTSVAVKPPVVAVASTNLVLTDLQTVGGVALAEGDRVLVVAQTERRDNGIYVAGPGTWLRAADFDGARDVVQGTIVLARSPGADGVIYEVTSPNPIIIGTSQIDFSLRDDPTVTYSQSLAETNALVVPTNTTYPPGNPRRQGAPADGIASARAALNTQNSTGEQIYLTTGSYLVDSNLTLTSPIVAEKGAIFKVANGVTLTVAGDFNGSKTQHFNCVGTGEVVFANGSVPCCYPEWWGAVPDAIVDGSGGTDCTAAIQKALNVPVVPVRLGAGNYLFTNLTQPNNKRFDGEGIHQANLIAKVGSTGTMYTDQGNAAKLDFAGIAFYANNCAYTHGFYIGHGGIPHGTEGYIGDVWVRDLPAGFPGIDINGNVGHYGRLLAQDTGGLQIIGVGNICELAQSYGSKGFEVATIQVATNLQLVSIGGLEIEATVAGVVPLYLTGNSDIDSITHAPIAGTTYPHMMEIGPGATSWRLGNVSYVFQGGAAPIITNGNIKSGTLYFGGNASGKNHGGEGNFASGMMLGGGDFGVKMQQLQCFTLRAQKSGGGVLQHLFGIPTDPTSGAGNFGAKINGALSTPSATPTGADASTAMVAGAKIGASSTNVIWLDTLAQVPADAIVLASITFNNTGADYNVGVTMAAIDINGTNRNRMGIVLTNKTSGANVAWATALGTNGYIIDVTCLVFLR